MKRESAHIATPIFAFHYAESGGFAPIGYHILFDSFSDRVISFDSLSTNPSISVMQLDSMKQNNLQESILRNEFFKAERHYPGEGPDMRDYVLSITMNDMSRTVYWNDVSTNEVPEGVKEIARQIKALVTK
jgi:hypothetical protein